MTVQAKFRCHQAQKGEGVDGPYCVVRLSAVTSDGVGNEGWSKWTPSGELSMHISNPAAFEQFEVGADYFIEFNKAE